MLDLSGNSITDISPLSGQPIRWLYIADRKVKGLGALLNMKDLKALNLTGVVLDENDRDILRSLKGVNIISDYTLEPDLK